VVHFLGISRLLLLLLLLLLFSLLLMLLQVHTLLQIIKLIFLEVTSHFLSRVLGSLMFGYLILF
jgi:hypothetical protein